MPHKSTRQLLKKIPGFPCLYRHSVNETYYGICKFRGNRKEHSLGTKDRKLAERLLKQWLADIEATDGSPKNLTVATLLESYERKLVGKAEKTQRTRRSILKKFKETWRHGEKMRVSDIRTSHLEEWLAQHESRLKNTTYNEYARFLKNLLNIAVHDRQLARSPFDDVATKWKKPQRPVRLTPTEEQFASIIREVRSQKFNPDASDSADFLEFLGLAGLGQKEAASLVWGDIDMANKRISVKRHKTSARFSVPMYPDLEVFILGLAAKRASSDRHLKVFAIADGKKALAAACGRLDFPSFSQRAIRRVLIRKLWRAGIDKKLIAKWQGHSDGGKLILDTYTEAFSEDGDAYEKLELSKLQKGE